MSKHEQSNYLKLLEAGECRAHPCISIIGFPETGNPVLGFEGFPEGEGKGL
jgi:hypothetical protein